MYEDNYEPFSHQMSLGSWSNPRNSNGLNESPDHFGIRADGDSVVSNDAIRNSDPAKGGGGGRFETDESRLLTTTDEQSQFKSSCDSIFGSGLNNFIRVLIPSYTTEIDSEGKYTSFNLLVQTAFAAVEIKRRYKNFLTLHQDLCQKISRDRLPQLPKKKRLGVLDPSFVDERRHSLERYLQELTAIREAWNCSCFIEFLDLSHPFMGVHIQVTRLTEDITRIGYENKSLHEQLEYSRELLLNSNQLINDLVHRVTTLEQIVLKSSSCRCTIHCQTVTESPENSTQLPQILDPIPLNSTVSSQLSTFSQLEALGESQRVQEGLALVSINVSSEEQAKHFQQDSPEWWNSESPKKSDNLVQISSTNLIHSVVEPPIPSFLVCPETVKVLHAIIPLQELFQTSVLSRLTNTVLGFMTPSVEQLKSRFQVEKYIAKLVRKSLGAQVYQMGLYSIRSFLPDDPLTLSIYLCRGLENSWYLRLNEKLCRMSSSIHAQTPPRESHIPGFDQSNGSPVNIRPSFDPSQEPVHHTPTHIIRNVSFMEENCEHRLQCVISNYTIDIRATQKIDLCFAAFIEEIDRTVGRDHLFKKSLIIIRTWWTLEGSSYSDIITTLPTSAICVMTCAIFNRFQREIYHPIHALMLFLTEYATFDWNLYALTVYGPILRSTVDSMSLTHEECLKLFPESLITLQLVGKYEDFLRQPADATEVDSPHTGDKTVSRESLINDLFLSLEGDNNPHFEETNKSIAPKEKFPGFIPSDCMKIFHPLSLSVNIIPGTISEHFALNMSELIQKGRDYILVILQLANEVEKSSGDMLVYNELESKFQLFFRETYAKYSQNWQPEMHKTMSFESLLSFELDSSVHETQKPSAMLFGSTSENSIAEDFTTELLRDPLAAPLDTLFEQIRYCNFLLGAEVSESTLQALSKDILVERGPLPVGEIGKMLQEITGISTLSAYLKDKFGGLKKFLENFEEFVICTDHPFNPHVFLRNTLNSEDYKLILSGIIPPHLTAKGNKRRATRKKRLSTPSIYSDSPPSTNNHNRIARSNPSSNYQGLRSVMSSPYLVSLGGHPHNQNSNYHYHGEAWDMAAGSGGVPSRAMSSSALERLNDPYHPDHSSQNPQFAYRNRHPQSQPSLPQPHSPYLSQGQGQGQDNYDQYTEIGYGSASNSYRSSSNGGGDDDEYGIMMETSLNLNGSYDLRRRKSLPLPAAGGGAGTGAVRETAKAYNPNGYGHMGIPDPRAPAFIPGSYR